jgi:hypothetical protein
MECVLEFSSDWPLGSSTGDGYREKGGIMDLERK